MNLLVRSVRRDFDKSVLYRNILKFLPREIAHLGVHWIAYHSQLEKDPPIWIWIVLVIPQLVIILYIVSIVLSRGESSFYDNIAGTKIGYNIGERMTSTI